MYNKPLRDDELPEPDDESWEDDTDVVDCPSCGAEVYEDAVRCPVCGEYVSLSSGANAWAGRSTWWIALGLAGVIAVILVLLR